MLRVLCVTCLFAGAGAATAQMADVRRDFVLLGNEAVGMLAPRVVSGAYTESISWSPDGTMLLAKRYDAASVEALVKASLGGTLVGKPAAPKSELVFYSVRANRIKSTVPLVEPGMHIHKMEWLAGSSQVGILYTRVPLDPQGNPGEPQTCAALVSSEGRVKLLATSTETGMLDMVVSKRDGQVALIHTTFAPAVAGGPPGMQAAATFLRATGTTTSVKFPSTYSGFEWGTNGLPYLLLRQPAKNGNPVPPSWNRFDPATGKTIPAGAEFKPASGDTPQVVVKGLRAVTTRVPAPTPKVGTEEAPQIGLVALVAGNEKPEGFALATSDGLGGTLSPTGDAVAYVHQGVALVRPLIRVPKEAYLEALNAAKRNQIMSNAKQVGLGLLIFAADNEDQLPGSGDNWMDKVNPYVKNRSLLDGFVFTLSGSNLTKLDSPATTEMGYIPGPGGRAVVYADGHVKWETAKPV